MKYKTKVHTHTHAHIYIYIYLYMHIITHKYTQCIENVCIYMYIYIYICVCIILCKWYTVIHLKTVQQAELTEICNWSIDNLAAIPQQAWPSPPCDCTHMPRCDLGKKQDAMFRGYRGKQSPWTGVFINLEAISEWQQYLNGWVF